jgi:class 3 adenylate cyclase/predicted ATPase
MDIAVWLRDLGLERYETAFRDNEIDQEALPKLTAEDLKDLGVVLGSHRRKLLDAIAAVQAGASSGTAPHPTPGHTPRHAPSGAERRQLTVMFCDLVGSTALSSQLDPEDLREVIGAYHNCVAKTVGGFDGFVAKYMGDGVLIYFGYPRAHENDAERAVMAALKLVGAVAALRPRSIVELASRVGIATGLVVVGDLVGSGEAQERGVVGETPNLAARLQGLAEPGAVMISEATRRLVGDLFEYRDLGAVAIRGLPEAVRVWQAVRPSAVESRFEALRSGTTPLVARDEELDLLLRRWQQAKTGEGRVVLLSGEPGIGKSRLTAALVERIEGEPHTRLRYFCSPHHRDSALYPFIVRLERAAGFARDDGPQEKLDKFATLLGPTTDVDHISLLVELLSLPGGERFLPLDLNPQRKKERTLSALVRQLEMLARQQPVLVIFEDLHWIDPTSRELLDLILAQIEHLPVLVVATFRPEFQPPWAGQPHVTVIGLNRLGRGDGAVMVERLAGKAALLPQEVIAEIVERTDGVPLFVEEMTKAVLEAGAERGRELAASVPGAMLGVPATLQASLMARLDRLGPAAKQVAQVGAAIGREFSYDLVAAIGELSEERLEEALQRLVDAGLVFQRGALPTAEYLFKHALVQDTAYGTLLRGPRQTLHGRIAAVLEQHFPDRAIREPEALARHFSEAQHPDRAQSYWLEAGRRAAERSANSEAIGHLTKALQALELLPESAQRDRQELTIRNTIGTPLIAVYGYASPEAGVAFHRARVLSGRVGDTRALFATLTGEWSFHFVRGDYRRIRELAEEALHASKSMNDEVLDLATYRYCGQKALHFGEFEAARDAFETIHRAYDPGRHRPPPVHYVHDSKLCALAYLPVVYWILGYPYQARTWQSAALDYAGGLAQAVLTTFVQIYGGAGLDDLLLDAPAVRNHADAIIDLADQHNLGYFRMGGQISKGWAMARQGEGPAGLELMRRGATERIGTGATWWQSRYLCMLAETCLQYHRTEEGLIAIAEATELMKHTEEHMWEAELARIEGELRRLQGAPASEAEGHFNRALTTARTQQAKSFELRAAMSLAGFWRDQGKRAEGRDLLAPVYGWFTEGFDTPDLVGAKALLDEL